MESEDAITSMTKEEAYREALRRISEARKRKLIELDLRNLIFDQIPPELFELEWLEVLDISRDVDYERPLSEIPIDLKKLKSLRLFGIFGYRIMNLSPLADLSQLQLLDCGDNQIEDLSPLSKLNQLQKLYCRGNKIVDLSPLSELSQLQQLDCESNQIMNLNPLSKLCHLQQLDCGFNQIENLNPLSKLDQLQRLDCRDNYISDLNPLSKLNQLQQLKCGLNYISNLNPLSKLNQLQQLYCWHNYISDLNPLSKLNQLQQLGFGSNRITDLSPLSKLSQLQQLYCGDNQIADLNPLSKLNQLQQLNCWGNQIENLNPIKLCLLSRQIHSFYCYGNPVRGIPPEIPGSDPDENISENICTYWEELDQSGAETNREVKVILVGNGWVGKTTLSHCFLHSHAPQAQTEERTHGIVTSDFEWPLLGEEKPIHIQLWDFGGQEIYHATHRLFLHRNALYLLLWAEETDASLKEQSHSVSYWRDQIRDLAGDSPIILVKNQIDRKDILGLPLDLENDTSDFVDHQKISALKYERIDLLQAAILEQISKLKDNWSSLIPKSWLTLKQDLKERRTDKTLSRAHFTQLCKKHNVKYTDTLLRYLHDSGFLYYRQGLFGDQLILDQNWIIDIVYKLFDPSKGIRSLLESLKGEFTGQQVRQFCWTEHEQDEIEVFIGFMLSSEIAFELESKYDKTFDERHFILPTLLPEQPPQSSSMFWDTPQPDEWWLDFSYRFLHRGVIERVIARTASLSPERDWWRDGILLQDEETNCSLLLQYRPLPELDNVIRLRLRRGNKPQALAKVRNLLEDLHRNRKPELFASLDGEQFVNLESLRQARQNGERHVVSREGKIIESEAFQVFLQIREDNEARFSKPEQKTETVKIFISYSHKDEKHKERLEVCLKNLKRLVERKFDNSTIDFWDDSQLLAGDLREQQILERLEVADIVLMLISPDFMASDHYFSEMEKALQKYKAKSGIPIPIIIRTTDGWYNHDIGKHSVLPTNGKHLAVWDDKDEFWVDVQKGIRRQVENILQRRLS